MPTYESYREKLNRRDVATPATLDTTDLREAIDDLRATLRLHDPSESPEAYYCDGEVTPSQAAARNRKWETRLNILEKEFATRLASISHYHH